MCLSTLLKGTQSNVRIPAKTSNDLFQYLAYHRQKRVSKRYLCHMTYTYQMTEWTSISWLSCLRYYHTIPKWNKIIGTYPKSKITDKVTLESLWKWFDLKVQCIDADDFWRERSTQYKFLFTHNFRVVNYDRNVILKLATRQGH